MTNEHRKKIITSIFIMIIIIICFITKFVYGIFSLFSVSPIENSLIAGFYDCSNREATWFYYKLNYLISSKNLAKNIFI